MRKIAIVTAVVILIGIVLAFKAGKTLPLSQIPQQGSVAEHEGQNQRVRVFFAKDGVSFEQYWPRDYYAPHMKADETEILVFNESNKTLEFKSIKVEYFVDGVKASEKSGTWEKFPSRTSWERTQYVNISSLHYKGEPLILTPSEKGKIHHHIEAGRDIPTAKDQKVKIHLVYTFNEEEVVIEKELIRDTPAAQGNNPQDNH